MEKVSGRGKRGGDGHPAVESPGPGEKYVSLADTDHEGGVSHHGDSQALHQVDKCHCKHPRAT